MEIAWIVPQNRRSTDAYAATLLKYEQYACSLFNEQRFSFQIQPTVVIDLTWICMNWIYIFICQGYIWSRCADISIFSSSLFYFIFHNHHIGIDKTVFFIVLSQRYCQIDTYYYIWRLRYTMCFIRSAACVHHSHKWLSFSLFSSFYFWVDQNAKVNTAKIVYAFQLMSLCVCVCECKWLSTMSDCRQTNSK